MILNSSNNELDANDYEDAWSKVRRLWNNEKVSWFKVAIIVEPRVMIQPA